MFKGNSEVFSTAIYRIPLTILSKGIKSAEVTSEPPGVLSDVGALGEELVIGASVLLSAAVLGSSGLKVTAWERGTTFVILVLRVRLLVTDIGKAKLMSSPW